MGCDLYVELRDFDPDAYAEELVKYGYENGWGILIYSCRLTGERLDSRYTDYDDAGNLLGSKMIFKCSYAGCGDKELTKVVKTG